MSLRLVLFVQDQEQVWMVCSCCRQLFHSIPVTEQAGRRMTEWAPLGIAIWMP